MNHNSLKSHRRTRLWPRLAVLSALAPALFPTEASAQESEPSYGGGLFFGYAFGQQRGFTWGLEAFGASVANSHSCSSKARSMVGGLVQLGFIGTSPHRITVALMGGREVAVDKPAITGEIGATYRYSDGALGLHLGVVPEWLTFNAAFRSELFLDDYSVAGGLRVLPTYLFPEQECTY